MSFGLETANSWTTSPAPEYMVCFASKHGPGMLLDRIHILGFVEHYSSVMLSLWLFSFIVGQGDS